MEIPFKVKAVDTSNKPNDIPTSKWLVKGKVYTVINVELMRMQNNEIGYKLSEIDLDDCFPYTRFGAWRFEEALEKVDAAKIDTVLELAI